MVFRLVTSLPGVDNSMHLNSLDIPPSLGLSKYQDVQQNAVSNSVGNISSPSATSAVTEKIKQEILKLTLKRQEHI